MSAWCSATLSSAGRSSGTGSPGWDPDTQHGSVDAHLFKAVWHALGGKRGLERPGLKLAVTVLAGGELTVGDEFWVQHGKKELTSDAFLEALVACKDTVTTPEFRWRPQEPARSADRAHTSLLQSVVHYAEMLESDAVVLFGWNLFIPEWAEASYGELLQHVAPAQPSQVVAVVPADFECTDWKDCDAILLEAVCHCFQARRRTTSSARKISHSLASTATRPCNIFTTRCRTETSAVLQEVLMAIQHLRVDHEVRAAAALCTTRIPRMRRPSSTGTSDAHDADGSRCTQVFEAHDRRETGKRLAGELKRNGHRIQTHTHTALTSSLSHSRGEVLSKGFRRFGS